MAEPNAVAWTQLKAAEAALVALRSVYPDANRDAAFRAAVERALVQVTVLRQLVLERAGEGD